MIALGVTTLIALWGLIGYFSGAYAGYRIMEDTYQFRRGRRAASFAFGATWFVSVPTLKAVRLARRGIKRAKVYRRFMKMR
jgi:hypothetical protein